LAYEPSLPLYVLIEILKGVDDDAVFPLRRAPDGHVHLDDGRHEHHASQCQPRAGGTKRLQRPEDPQQTDPPSAGLRTHNRGPGLPPPHRQALQHAQERTLLRRELPLHAGQPQRD